MVGGAEHRQRRGRDPAQAHAAQLEVHRPVRDGARRHVDRFVREHHGLGVEPDREPSAAIGVERHVRLLPVHEHPGGCPVGADGPAHRLDVVDARRQHVGQGRRHVGEGLAERGEEGVLAPQLGVARREVAGRADRRVEVVVEDGEVVGVAGRLRLLEAGPRVHAAGVHVVALPARPVADLAVGDRGDVERTEERAAMVRGRHAAAELARGGGEVGRGQARRDAVVVAPDARVVAQVGADAGVVPGVGEEEVLAEGRVPRLVGVDPEPVAVAAVEGEHLARGQVGAAPRGRGEDRRREAVTARHPLERDEVAGLVVELVLELDARSPGSTARSAARARAPSAANHSSTSAR